MNAKEMFEKLGYKRKEDEYYITYENYKKGILSGTIQFFKNSEHVCFYNFSTVINKDELQAVNTMAKELGWLEDCDDEDKQ